MKHFKILGISEPNEEYIRPLTIDDYIVHIQMNRARIRIHSNLMSNISGMLLSAYFVIIFFFIRENNANILIKIVTYAMFLGIISLVFTLFFSILSISLPKPKSVLSNGDRLNNQNVIYSKEFRRMRTAQKTLMVSIGLFISALVLFFVQVSIK